MLQESTLTSSASLERENDIRSMALQLSQRSYSEQIRRNLRGFKVYISATISKLLKF